MIKDAFPNIERHFVCAIYLTATPIMTAVTAVK
jgi:hypothetical protein